eukprot:958713-Prorocentrum_minimum.AAC.1
MCMCVYISWGVQSPPPRPQIHPVGGRPDPCPRRQRIHGTPRELRRLPEGGAPRQVTLGGLGGGPDPLGSQSGGWGGRGPDRPQEADWATGGGAGPRRWVLQNPDIWCENTGKSPISREISQ